MYWGKLMMAINVHAKDLDAMHYRNHSTFQYEAAMKLIESYPFKETHRVLDVGCGDGRITAELSQCLPKGQAVGIDLSPAMIALAKDSFSKQDYPNLNFHECNAEEIPYSNQFDIVMSCNCLHWVTNKEKAFRKMAEALVPGGDLLILMGAKDEDVTNFMIEPSKDPRWSQYTPHTSFSNDLSPAECRKVFEDAGMDVHRCEVIESVAEFACKEEFSSFIKIWVNYYFPLPENLQEEYLELVVNTTAKHSSGIDGSIRLPFKGLMIKAQKRS